MTPSVRATIISVLCWSIAACSGVDPGDPEYHDCTDDLYYSGFTGYDLAITHFDPRICPVDGTQGEIHDNGTLTTSVTFEDGEPHDNVINWADILIQDFVGQGNKQYNVAQFNIDVSGLKTATLDTQYEIDTYGRETSDYYEFGIWENYDPPTSGVVATAEGQITYCWGTDCPEGEAEQDQEE